MLVKFLINPFWGFMSAMRNLNQKYAGIVYVAFFALFGYAISFTLTTADSYRIGARFCQTNYVGENVWEMYLNGEITDFYMISVYSIIKQFTNNPKVLFGVFGFTIGIFSYMAVREMYRLWDGRDKRIFYFLVLCFFCTVSFTNVNGIRFFTAAPLFLYSFIRFHYYKEPYAIIGILVTPIIHFGYLIVLLAYIVVYGMRVVFHNNRKYYIYLFSICFAINIASPQGLADDVFETEGEAMTESAAINAKVGNYSNTSANVARQNSRAQKNAAKSLYRQANSIYTTILQNVNKFGVFLMIILMYKHRNRWEETENEKRYFNCLLSLFCVSYLAAFLVSSGGRFVMLSSTLFYFYVYSLYRHNTSYRNRQFIKKFLIPINLYSISFLIINAPRLVTWMLWIFPFPITIIDGIGFGSIDFI